MECKWIGSRKWNTARPNSEGELLDSHCTTALRRIWKRKDSWCLAKATIHFTSMPRDVELALRANAHSIKSESQSKTVINLHEI